jgi:hypothetical protein
MGFYFYVNVVHLLLVNIYYLYQQLHTHTHILQRGRAVA